MEIYMILGEVAHVAPKSGILLGIREPAMWVAPCCLVMIVLDNDHTFHSKLQEENKLNATTVDMTIMHMTIMHNRENAYVFAETELVTI